MPLIVAPDDGYESLVSVEAAAAYMARFGHSWPTEVDKQEIALRKATQYLMTAYRIQPQNLNPVHANVAAACCEAAVRALSAPLFADTDGRIKVSQTVGPISTTWAEGANGGKASYPVIDNLLKGLTDSNDSMTIRMVRG